MSDDCKPVRAAPQPQREAIAKGEQWRDPMAETLTRLDRAACGTAVGGK